MPIDPNEHINDLLDQLSLADATIERHIQVIRELVEEIASLRSEVAGLKRRLDAEKEFLQI